MHALTVMMTIIALCFLLSVVMFILVLTKCRCGFSCSHAFHATGVPLLYLSMLYASKDKIVSRAVETEIVYMLCQDYTVEYWYVLLLDVCLCSVSLSLPSSY